MIWIDYQRIDQLVLKKDFIQTDECMGVRTDERSLKTIIFVRGVRKYVRVTLIMTFDRAYVTYHKYNWPPF